MRSFLFWVTSYILIGVTLLQNVNSLDNSDQPNLFSSNDGDDTSSSDPIMIPDLGTDDLWSSSDLTNFIDADNTEPMFDDHNDDFSIASCSPSSNSDTLNRRRGGAGETCTNPQKLNEDAQEQNPPADVKFRLTGTTKDQPILIPTYNLEICDALIMGTFRTIVACDSGRKEDRKPTTDMGVFILEHCTPCKLCSIPALFFIFRFFFYPGTIGGTF